MVRLATVVGPIGTPGYADFPRHLTNWHSAVRTMCCALPDHPPASR